MNKLAGTRSGQQYPLAKAIKSFLDQMGQNIPIGAALVKELMQNADDARATELHLYLDERPPAKELDRQLRTKDLGPLADALLGPALVVRNNQPFRKPQDEGAAAKDDFKALCEVAWGHKVDEVTAAGRFGMGFNSAYLVTETPLIFSRREVHVFDPRCVAFEEGGWQFGHEDLKNGASGLGVEKPLLYWCFPRRVMGEAPPLERAVQEDLDCLEAVFRLPFRTKEDAPRSLVKDGIDHFLYAGVFPDPASRRELARVMFQTASEAVVFMKHLRLVSLWEVRDGTDEPELLGRIQVDREQPDPLPKFLQQVESTARIWQEAEEVGQPVETHLFQVKVRTTGRPDFTPEDEESTRSFLVRHRACFDSEELLEIARNLRRNQERCIPWVAAALPADRQSFLNRNGSFPSWRVFLPLTEEGPSNALLHAACFVDPSRRGMEYADESQGSDAVNRKTRWNKALIEHGLAPLLAELSLDLAEQVKDLIDSDPERYLSLLPSRPAGAKQAPSLAEHLRHCFHEQEALVTVFDLWGEPLELVLGGTQSDVVLEVVPEWLAPYKKEFRSLSSERHRFIPGRLGQALDKVLPGSVKKTPSPETAARILRAEHPPKEQDLVRLLKLLDHLDEEALEGCWALVETEGQDLVRYDSSVLHILSPGRQNLPAPLRAVLAAGMKFQGIRFVQPQAGLADPKLRPKAQVENLLPAEGAVFEALDRVDKASVHDSCPSLEPARPLVDYLLQHRSRVPDSLHLAWLVRTAAGVADRKGAGVLVVPPTEKTGDVHDLWEGFARETFAQVEPTSGRDLVGRLLEAGFEEYLTDRDGTRVLTPTPGKMLRLLSQAAARDPRVFERLEKAMNRPVSKGGPLRPEALRASSLLLQEADKIWEALALEEREVFLQLPIHRTSDGRMLALQEVSEEGEEVPVQRRFRLQGSEDDLHDAPVEMPEGLLLLHNQDKSAFRFYRNRLSLNVHNRVAVLKDCLRQIGRRGGRQDEGLFKYLCRYLKQALEDLDRSSQPGDAKDVQQLKELLDQALLVPTSSGTWSGLRDCVDADDCRKRLKKAGFRVQELEPLLAGLFHPLAVVANGQADRLRDLPVRPEEASLEEAARGALRSESPDLSLQDRVRVILALKNELEDSDCASIEIQRTVEVSSGGRRIPLEQALLPRRCKVPSRLQFQLVEEVLDLEALSKDWGLSENDLRTSLTKLGAKQVPEEGLDNALSARFGTLWPTLPDDERLSILRHLAADNSRRDRFKALGSTHEVVLCEDGEWRPLEETLPPRWREPKPPRILRMAVADSSRGQDDLVGLWDHWSPLQTAADLARCVLEAFAKLEEKARKIHLTDLSKWIVNLDKQDGSPGLCEEIRRIAWVPARRGSERRLACPEEVLLHKAGELLACHFLVADVPFDHLPHSVAGLRFQKHLEPTALNLGLLARCLAEAECSSPEVWRAAYQEAEGLLDRKSELRDHWVSLARELKVFHLFRQPAQRVSLDEVFLQGSEEQGDFGDLLYCLECADQIPDGVAKAYAGLEVDENPTWAHLAGALVAFSGRTSAEADLYASLVQALRELPKDAPKDSPEATELCLLACDGTYRPLKDLVTDEELGLPKALVPDSQALVVDRRCTTSAALLKLLKGSGLATPPVLRGQATVHLPSPPAEVPETAEVQQRIAPWKDWLGILHEEGSVVHEAFSQIPGVRFPPHLGSIVPVKALHVEYRLPDGRLVETQPAAPGPLAAADPDGRLFVRPDDPCWSGTDVPDQRIGDAIARAMAGPEAALDRVCATLREQVAGFLERPSHRLQALAEANKKSLLDLYRDQNANEEFERLWASHSRTARKSERSRLEDQMRAIVEEDFVRRRADQIRGHGYDESSVFAELVQNAEDAYLQGERLELEIPQPAWVRFQVLQSAAGATLQVEHLGRPFNYWRHNDKSEPLFRYDVEGLLRSAGSFKPQAKPQSGPPSIGRFGLGFKSVFLLTDRPRIHSHIYHFEIECGCIPKEVSPPADLEGMATRILLPLRSGLSPTGFLPPERARLLAVFLRAIRQIDFTQALGDGLSVSTRICFEVPAGPDTVVQQVELSSAGADKTSTLRLVRVRSASGENPAQVALMLDEAGMPMPWPWKQDSEADFFATLPLKARLGCGVAVSHQFDVESGRTHLRQDEGNTLRFEETARRVRVLVEHLVEVCRTGAETAEGAHSPCAILERFWGIWRWDRGDSELKALRQDLAEHLLKAAEDLPVAPTLEPDALVPIGTTTELFVTTRLPLELVLKLTEVQVEVPVPGAGMIPMMRSRTLTHPFLQALSRLTDRAGRPPSGTLVKIGWPELGHAFQTGTWLADYPHFVGIMARSLEGNERKDVLEWLPKCRVSGASERRGTVQDLPNSFLSWKAPDLEFLPEDRVLLLDRGYDEDALCLLGEAGLNETVPREEIEVWLSEGLKTEDAINLLRYFVRSGRWRAVYYEARNAVRGKWILAEGERLTPAAAHSRALIPKELLQDSGFKEWLDVQPGLRPYIAPSLDARKTLHDIYDWWAKEGPEYIRKYVKRTYPGGRRPGFGSLESPGALREWLVLLLLGSMHTMGGFQPRQHRGFLEMCHDMGWLDIFARPDATAEEWIGVLDSYIDTKMEYGQYSHWMRQFISIYQISRHLPAYMEQILDLDRVGRRFELHEVFKSKSSALQRGTGNASPSLTKILGDGQNFVLRELVRTGALLNEACYEHCLVPYKRVEELLGHIRSFDKDRASGNAGYFGYLMHVFEGDIKRASFDLAFDIPFQFIAEDKHLQHRFLRNFEPANEDELDSRLRMFLRAR